MEQELQTRRRQLDQLIADRERAVAQEVRRAVHTLRSQVEVVILARERAASLEARYRELQRAEARGAPAFPEITTAQTDWLKAQAQVVQEVLAAAKREHYRVSVIEAFDQPWKEHLEGTVGGHWGLLDGKTREFKFAWGVPVSNHPNWGWQAAGGIAFAAVVFGMAFAAYRREPFPNGPMLGRWLGVAITGFAGGALIGWVAANVPIESLGVEGWARSLILAGLAVTSPIAGAAALMRGTALPSFAQVIGPAAMRVPDPLKLLLGAVLVLLGVFAIQSALGLVFDPRYRDFPFAPMTAALVPLLTLSFTSPRRAGRRPPAETARCKAGTLPETRP